MTNHEDEEVIFVEWTDGSQAIADSNGKYQAIARATGNDLHRYYDWLLSQPNQRDFYELSSSPSSSKNVFNKLDIFFLHKGYNQLFNKKSRDFAIMFKTAWQDRHWT